MRQIKFRAWDEKQKYMAYQGTPDLETIQSFFHHFGNCELMQFTGLTDKNGREIYEGDICLIKAEEPLLTEQFSTEYNWELICKVKFDIDYCGFVFKDFATCLISELNSVDAEIEVIGNIHETLK